MLKLKVAEGRSTQLTLQDFCEAEIGSWNSKTNPKDISKTVFQHRDIKPLNPVVGRPGLSGFALRVLRFLLCVPGPQKVMLLEKQKCEFITSTQNNSAWIAI